MVTRNDLILVVLSKPCQSAQTRKKVESMRANLLRSTTNKMAAYWIPNCIDSFFDFLCESHTRSKKLLF